MNTVSTDDPGLIPGALVFLVLLGLGHLALSLTRSNRDNLNFQYKLFFYAALVRASPARWPCTSSG